MPNAHFKFSAWRHIPYLTRALSHNKIRAHDESFRFHLVVRTMLEHVVLDHQSLLDIGYIFVYEAACAIFLPLPSEAPMFLFPDLSRVTVLAACALGKGFGSYLVFIFGDYFSQTTLFDKVIELLRLKNFWMGLMAWSERFMKSYGFIGFLILMSLPGMPMRSAIYSVSILGINGVQFALGSAVGTVIRSLLVYGGYRIFFRA